MKNKIILSFGIFLMTLSLEYASAGIIVKPEPAYQVINEASIIPSTSVDMNRVVPSSEVEELASKLAEGKSYVWGGNTNVAVDCSSFTQQFMRAYKGLEIPRVTYDQVKVGKQVFIPEPGDLIFFNNYSHVGVYVGNGMMVDALNPKEGVGVRAVNYVYGKVDGYYRY